jgi:hypothetical protein
MNRDYKETMFKVVPTLVPVLEVIFFSVTTSVDGMFITVFKKSRL